MWEHRREKEFWRPCHLLEIFSGCLLLTALHFGLGLGEGGSGNCCRKKVKHVPSGLFQPSRDFYSLATQVLLTLLWLVPTFIIEEMPHFRQRSVPTKVELFFNQV